MSALQARACTRHSERAASGRCMDCGLPYCKECLTPHGEGLACATCLARYAAPELKKERSAHWAWAGSLLGLLVLWTCYAVGAAALARQPSHTQGHLSPHWEEP